MFDELKEVKEFYNVKYFKEMKHLKSLQKAGIQTTIYDGALKARS